MASAVFKVQVRYFRLLFVIIYWLWGEGLALRLGVFAFGRGYDFAVPGWRRYA